MQERRQSPRYNISFPVRITWKDEHGREVVQEGLTENVGQQGALIFLPRTLPSVGSKVNLIRDGKRRRRNKCNGAGYPA